MADDELIVTIARAVGLELPPEDLPALSAAFANQQQAVAALEAVDVSELEPLVAFDPRWR